MAYDTIWESIPPWQSPKRLYELTTAFTDSIKRGEKLSKALDNEFSEQLLRVIWLVYKPKRLEDKLRQIGADAEGIIQDCVIHLRKKISEGKFELRASDKPESGLPLLSALKRAVFLFTIDERKKIMKTFKNERKATDEWGSDPEDRGMDSFTMPEECFDVERLDKLKEELEDECIGSIKCSPTLQLRWLTDAYSRIFDEVVAQEKPPKTEEEPELSNLIRSRIARAIRSFARSGTKASS